MITATTSPTIEIKTETNKNTIFVSKSPENNITAKTSDGSQVLEAKSAGGVVVVGGCKDSKQITINGKPETTVLTSTPSTVFKVFDGAAETSRAVGQIMKGQIVVMIEGGQCKVASSNDEQLIFLPIKIAQTNAADGEEILVANLDKEFETVETLKTGAPVFIGENGWATSTQSGAISVAIGVATSVNKFYSRTGLRVRVVNN